LPLSNNLHAEMKLDFCIVAELYVALAENKADSFSAEPWDRNIHKDKWQQYLPSAAKCLENSIEAFLTFFICPEEESISLRTTNIIERLNKEFKRRTKSMEIVV